MWSKTVDDFIRSRNSLSSFEREQQHVSLGNIINIFRADQGLSLSGFAEISGISKPYVSMLERGINPSTQRPVTPSIVTFKKAAQAMGVPLDDLMHAVSDDQPISLMNPSQPDEDGGDLFLEQKPRRQRSPDKMRTFRSLAKIAGYKLNVTPEGKVIISSKDNQIVITRDHALFIESEIENYVRFTFERINPDYPDWSPTDFDAY